MTKSTTTIVPTQPGFDLVKLAVDPQEFYFVPVIAWAIESESDDHGYVSAVVHAITTDWNYNNNTYNEIVRRPDGCIEFIDEVRFAKGKERQALAYAIKQRKKREAKLKHRAMQRTEK